MKIYVENADRKRAVEKWLRRAMRVRRLRTQLYFLTNYDPRKSSLHAFAWIESVKAFSKAGLTPPKEMLYGYKP